jgi:RNA 3'-terminal phosphate cyclase (ATP)
MIAIDGSTGEGGGQIIRSALALAIATGKEVTIFNVRAKRAKPGLQPQHLVAVKAAAEICHAQVQGNVLGSTEVVFRPGPIVAGNYTWDIGTAGSTSLVLQTVLLPLLLAGQPSTVTIIGGTHNPLAPTFEFLRDSFFNELRKMGATVESEILRQGFYPRGGGRVVFHIPGNWQPRPYHLEERGNLRQYSVSILLARLPRTIAVRERDTFLRLCDWGDPQINIDILDDAFGPGNAITVTMEHDNVTAVFSSIGERKKPSEVVAEEAWRQTADYLAHDAPVEPHLADQLLLPGAWAAACGVPFSFRTVPLSSHGVTHAQLIETFLPVRVELINQPAGTVTVRLCPANNPEKDSGVARNRQP